METVPAPPKPIVTAPSAAGKDVPFGVNEVRLSARQWLAVGAILTLVAILTPRLWERIERFETGPDYRIPYQSAETLGPALLAYAQMAKAVNPFGDGHAAPRIVQALMDYRK